jgi:hypothetical protein
MVRKIPLPGVGGIKSPQPNLELVFGDFYGSSPVDPSDCALYPDSSFYGGFPFSPRPIVYNLSIVRDECNVGIQMDAVLSFIKLPPVQFVHRNKNCIPKQKPLEPPDTGTVTNDTQTYEYPTNCEYPNLSINLYSRIEFLDDPFIVSNLNYSLETIHVVDVENLHNFGDDGMGAIITFRFAISSTY